MELKKSHYFGLAGSFVFLIISLLFLQTDFFLLLIGISVIVGATPFVITIIQQNKIEIEKEEMFLEFARNLVESVKTGTPINKSIVNVKNKEYGVLSPHVKKLANQISMGIPLITALKIFSEDLNNKTISRSLTLIGQAERAGGEIGGILEAVVAAVNTSDKLKKERKASISTLVMQGYIIFFVFIIIILVMQFKILPIVSGISGIGEGSSIEMGGDSFDQKEISDAFLYLLLIQGLFNGLTIGKLSEGNIWSGVKHSFTLMLVSFVVAVTANLIFI